MKYVFPIVLVIAFLVFAAPLSASVDWYNVEKIILNLTGNNLKNPSVNSSDATSPDSSLSEQKSFVNDSPPSGEITPQAVQKGEDIPVTPPAKESKQNNAKEYLNINDNRPFAANEEGLFALIKSAFQEHQASLEIKIAKNIFSGDTLSQTINKVNLSHEETNYYISRYNFKAQIPPHEDFVYVDLVFEYKEVLKGFNTDDNKMPKDTLLISNYEEFAAVVQKAIENSTEKVKYKFTNPNLDTSLNTLLAIVQKVADGNRGNYVASYGIDTFGKGGFITINYFYPAERVKEIKAEVDKKAQEIVSTVIKPGMTALEKEKALHDYVVLNTRYDDENFKNNTVPKDSYTAYGALIKGVAVCEGYATAMDKLLKLAGIESKIITGTANNGSTTVSHAWNLVKIDGKWYHLDTTWDDPAPDIPGHVSHEYFNLTEEEIRKDHQF